MELRQTKQNKKDPSDHSLHLIMNNMDERDTLLELRIASSLIQGREEGKKYFEMFI